MKSLLPKDVKQLSLFVWLMHRINEEFKDHAILKGGMVLGLLDSNRYTNDLDYVFVPYKSKKELSKTLEKIFSEIPNVKVEKSMHSTSLQYLIMIDNVKVQIEANVDLACPSIPMSTVSLASKTNQLAQIIKVMNLDVALSHKLAAWNERRLLRDLYDVYFLYSKLNIKPDLNTLKKRLSKISSRIPALRKIKSMTIEIFKNELEKQAEIIDNKGAINELSSILDKSEIVGIDLKIKIMIHDLCENIGKSAEQHSPTPTPRSSKSSKKMPNMF